MIVNDFHKDLEWSHQQSDQPWWEVVYRRAFHNFSTMHDVRKDGWAQRGGIDRQVLLSDGTVLKIDEKVRRDDWPDFALEYYSDARRKTPGWMQKDLTCDFIAYAFEPSQRCFLLPYQQLRTAWVRNRKEWHKKYGSKLADNPNGGYKTAFIPVPIDVVLSAIVGAMKVTWEAPAPTQLHSRDPDVPF